MRKRRVGEATNGGERFKHDKKGEIDSDARRTACNVGGTGSWAYIVEPGGRERTKADRGRPRMW